MAATIRRLPPRSSPSTRPATSVVVGQSGHRRPCHLGEHRASSSTSRSGAQPTAFVGARRARGLQSRPACGQPRAAAVLGRQAYRPSEPSTTTVRSVCISSKPSDRQRFLTVTKQLAPQRFARSQGKHPGVFVLGANLPCLLPPPPLGDEGHHSLPASKSWSTAYSGRTCACENSCSATLLTPASPCSTPPGISTSTSGWNNPRSDGMYALTTVALGPALRVRPCRRFPAALGQARKPAEPGQEA